MRHHTGGKWRRILYRTAGSMESLLSDRLAALGIEPVLARRYHRWDAALACIRSLYDKNLKRRPTPRSQMRISTRAGPDTLAS